MIAASDLAWNQQSRADEPVAHPAVITAALNRFQLLILKQVAEFGFYEKLGGFSSRTSISFLFSHVSNLIWRTSSLQALLSILVLDPLVDFSIIFSLILVVAGEKFFWQLN